MRAKELGLAEVPPPLCRALSPALVLGEIVRPLVRARGISDEDGRNLCQLDECLITLHQRVGSANIMFCRLLVCKHPYPVGSVDILSFACPHRYIFLTYMTWDDFCAVSWRVKGPYVLMHVSDEHIEWVPRRISKHLCFRRSF